MSETSRNGKLSLVVVALLGVGFFVLKNMDGCSDGANTAAGDGPGVVGDAPGATDDGGRVLDEAATTEAEARASQRATEAVEQSRSFGEVAGLAEETVRSVAAAMEEDAGLPEEEWGLHEGDPVPDITGEWCTLEPSGTTHLGRRYSLQKPAGQSDSWTGKAGDAVADSLKYEQTDDLEIGIRRAQFCIRNITDEGELECMRLVRATRNQITFYEGDAMRAWVRCPGG